MKLNTLYRASMESVENPVDEVPPVAVVTDGYIDQKVLEAKEAEAEATNSDATITRLMDIAEGLEAIALGIEAHRVNGLSQEAAFYANVAIGIHAKNLGLEGFKDPRLGMESFVGSKAGHSTRVTLEGLNETIKKIWETIKEAVAKFAKAVAEFINKLMDVSPKLATKAQDIAHKASAGGTETKGSIKAESLASKLAVNGKFPTNCAAELKLVEKNLDAFIGSQGYASAMTKYIDDLAKFGLRLVRAGSKGSLDAHLPEVFKFTAPFPQGLRDSPAHTAGYTVKQSEEFPGDHQITMRFPKAEDGSGVEGAKKYIKNLVSGAEFYLHKPVDRKPAQALLPVLSYNEIKATAEASEVIFKKVAEFRTHLRTIESERQAVQHQFEEMANEMEKSDVAGSEVLVDLLRSYALLSRQSEKAVTQVLAFSVDTARAFLTLCEKSLAAHEGKQEEPAHAEAA